MMMMMVIMNSPSAPICFLFAEALVKESHQEIASTISEASLPSGKISTPKKKTKSSVRGDVFGDKGANTHMETTSPGRREMPWLGRLCRLETWVLPACEGLFRGRNKKSTVSTRWTLPKILVEVPFRLNVFNRHLPLAEAPWRTGSHQDSFVPENAQRCPLGGAFFWKMLVMVTRSWWSGSWWSCFLLEGFLGGGFKYFYFHPDV